MTNADAEATAAERQILSHHSHGHKLHEQDAPPLSPLQILITALVFMLIFVLTLVTVAINIGRQ